MNQGKDLQRQQWGLGLGSHVVVVGHVGSRKGWVLRFLLVPVEALSKRGLVHASHPELEKDGNDL